MNIFCQPFVDPKKTINWAPIQVNWLDTRLGETVDLLKEKGMYDDTLIVFTSDNDGPVYYGPHAGANNFPLKGGVDGYMTGQDSGRQTGVEKSGCGLNGSHSVFCDHYISLHILVICTQLMEVANSLQHSPFCLFLTHE